MNQSNVSFTVGFVVSKCFSTEGTGEKSGLVCMNIHFSITWVNSRPFISVRPCFHHTAIIFSSSFVVTTIVITIITIAVIHVLCHCARAVAGGVGGGRGGIHSHSGGGLRLHDRNDFLNVVVVIVGWVVGGEGGGVVDWRGLVGGGGGSGSFWGRAGGGITITNVTMDRSRPRGGVSFWLWRVSVDGVITAAAAVLIVLGQTLHFEILCDCEERVEFLLGNVDFSMIHEVEHSLKIAVVHPLEVQEGVGVGVAPQDPPEERAAGR